LTCSATDSTTAQPKIVDRRSMPGGVTFRLFAPSFQGQVAAPVTAGHIGIIAHAGRGGSLGSLGVLQEAFLCSSRQQGLGQRRGRSRGAKPLGRSGAVLTAGVAEAGWHSQPRSVPLGNGTIWSACRRDEGWSVGRAGVRLRRWVLGVVGI